MRQHSEEQKTRREANILIIDDDAESALLMQSVFTQLGCETTCLFNSIDARKSLVSQKADLIILDWQLDAHTDAGQIVNQCNHTLAKFENSKKTPKVVTCSSLEASEIALPESPYFEYLDHWQKPMTRSHLLTHALHLLESLGHIREEK